MVKLTPMNGYAVLKPVELQEEMAGNIFLPDMGKEKPEVGEIVSVSGTYNWHNGETVVEKNLQPGTKVLIPKMGSQRVSIKGEEFYITKVTEIITIIEEL